MNDPFSQKANAGEAVASRSYRRALDLDFPDEIKQVLGRHAGLIEESHAQVALLAGLEDRAMVVQLFDSPAAAQSAIGILHQSGIDANQIETSELAHVAQEYRCDCHTSRVLESTAIGALLASVAGAALGVVVGTAVLIDPSMAGMGIGEILSLTVPIGLISGGVLGGFFGLLLGHSTAEDDEFLYNWSLRAGNTLVAVETDRRQTDSVRQMLASVNHRGVVAA